MEILVLWLGTCIASVGMKLANELRVFKDVADAGYKIDVNKLLECGNQLNPNASKVTSLSMLIPIFNMMQVFQKIIQYNNIRPLVLDQLNVIGALEEMSEIEKAEYLRKPTGLNALMVLLKSEIRLARANSIKISNDDGISEIYYKMGNSLDDITILKVTGSATRLTVEEQKKQVVETLETLVQAGLEEYGDVDTLIDALKNNASIDVNNSEEDKRDEEIISPISQELSISEQQQALESIKSELLRKQEVVQSSLPDKNARLAKKKEVARK